MVDAARFAYLQRGCNSSLFLGLANENYGTIGLTIPLTKLTRKLAPEALGICHQHE
jgi:hypothetical protein